MSLHKNWNSVVEVVMLTGQMYVHRHLTIERRDGSACIAILREGTTDYFTKVEALSFLEDFEF